MFGSEMLEVAIGLVFVYLLLSLICSVLNEWIARVFGMRSKTLKSGIRALLADDQAVEKLYGHTIIKGLAQQGWYNDLVNLIRRLPLVEKVVQESEAVPSYISGQDFALALFDTLQEAGNPNSGKNVQVSADDIDADGKSKALQRYAGDAFKDLEAGIDGVIADEEARKALRAILNSVKAETDRWDEAIATARASVEQWFDLQMERVTGWYRRQAQLIILVLALIVSFTLNTDTLMMANRLSSDARLRAEVVAAAVQTSKEPLPAGSDTPLTRVGELQAELQQLGLPVGWVQASDEYEDPREVPNDQQGWFYKILGLLVTGLAVSLGAPFWFDLLNKLVNLRTTGKKPAESSEVGAGEGQ